MEEQNWDQGTTESVSLEEMDNLIREMKKLEADYEEAKKVSTAKYKVYEEMEQKVLSIMQSAGKSKISVDGLGSAYILNRYVTPTPKTNGDKEAFFNYIESKYGRDVLLSKLSVNSNTLNSFCKEERESAEREGRLLDIPGLEAPTHQTSLGFRKA